MTTTPYKKLTYDDTKVQVESAIRDGEGVKISTKYAKKTEIQDGVLTIQTNGGSSLGTFSANQSTNQTITLPNGTVQLLNQSVTFVANTDSSTNTEFPYRASVTVSGISSSTYAEVTYSEDQATSLNFATFIETATDVIYLYSRTNVGTVTIPTISIGMDYSDITIDATPTSGSGNAVSSGGVYTALSTKANDNAVVKLTGNQEVAGVKTFTSRLQVKDVEPPYLILNSSLTDRTTNPSSTISIALAKIGTSTTGQEEYGYSNLVSRIGSDGVRDLALSVCNKLGNWVDLSLHNDVDGNGNVTCYAYSPHRSYATATNDDILVKAHVTDMMAQMPLTSGTGTVYGSCSLENSANPIRWFKVGRVCTVIFAIRTASTYTGTYTQYCLATGLPASAIGNYPYGSQGLSVDGQTDSGGALGYVNTSGHLYYLARAQNMAGKVLVGSVTYITA